MPATTLPSQFSAPARFILHATDFSPASELAFAHALRLALANRANLSLLHVGENTDAAWDSFPPVRSTLERWGFLEPGSQRADIAKLGIGIDKIIARASNVADVIAHHALSRQVDMLVVGTEQRHDLLQWLRPSTAEKMARKLTVPTLFVPGQGRSCIRPDDGFVTLDQILVPVDHEPPVDEAIERGLRALALFGSEQSRLTLLHVGARFPAVRVPDGPWQISRATRDGDPVAEILAAADEMTANLLIMVTRGREGFLDAVRGTTTEQVLRRAPCPVLSIPADG